MSDNETGPQEIQPERSVDSISDVEARLIEVRGPKFSFRGPQITACFQQHGSILEVTATMFRGVLLPRGAQRLLGSTELLPTEVVGRVLGAPDALGRIRRKTLGVPKVFPIPMAPEALRHFQKRIDVFRQSGIDIGPPTAPIPYSTNPKVDDIDVELTGRPVDSDSKDDRSPHPESGGYAIADIPWLIRTHDGEIDPIQFRSGNGRPLPSHPKEPGPNASALAMERYLEEKRKYSEALNAGTHPEPVVDREATEQLRIHGSDLVYLDGETYSRLCDEQGVERLPHVEMKRRAGVDRANVDPGVIEIGTKGPRSFPEGLAALEVGLPEPGANPPGQGPKEPGGLV